MDTQVVECLRCGAQNRVSSRSEGLKPICGRCGLSLILRREGINSSQAKRKSTDLQSKDRTQRFHPESFTGDHPDKFIKTISRHQLSYSKLGLVIGLALIVGGIVLFLAGVTGKMSWTANLFGATSVLLDAAPGAVLFVVGLFIVLITLYKLKSKR